MHFGIICPPVPGHIHPFGALGRELIGRGHRVTLFHMQDLEERVRREEIDFVPIGASDHPPGSLGRSLAELGQLQGTAALRFTIRAVGRTTAMMLRDGPDAIHQAKVTALLVDQMEPAGGTLAEHLGLPFITVCNALALNREPDIPPPFTPWRFQRSWWSRMRNRVGYAVSDRLTRPISRVVAHQRSRWGLAPHAKPEDSFSTLAQISQQTEEFDFPRRLLPPEFHYVGPLRRNQSTPVSFPWRRLDGRPLVYASLGTLQNSRLGVFQCFAEACEGLDAQLVIAHGGGLQPSEESTLRGNVVVTGYAPQRELIERARLTLTHAGLNTVLDSLSFGVPAIAIPITYEQPAIAERLRRTGAGVSIPLPGLKARRLRESICRILADPRFYARAGEIAAGIRKAGGVGRAADIILEKTTRRPR